MQKLARLWGKKKDQILNAGIYVLVFLSLIFPYSDKDWGWHYRYGEYFFTHHALLLRDIYSWTMNGFLWVNHSWLYDLLLYLLSKYFGFSMLSLLGSGCAVLCLAILSRSFRLVPWKLFLIAVFFILLTQAGVEGGLRSQVVSLVFFALLMTVLVRIQTHLRSAYLLVPFFFIWANLHGDFTLGLAISGLFLITFGLVNFFTHDDSFISFGKKYLLPLFFAGLITLVNPFTYNVYLESLWHLENPYLKNVLEWDPVFDNCSSCHAHTFLLYNAILLGIFLYAFKRKEVKYVPYAVLVLTLFWMTYNTRRLMPVYFIVTVPALFFFLTEVRPFFEKYKTLPYILLFLLLIGIEFNLTNRLTSFPVLRQDVNVYCLYASGCSPETVTYLKAHPPVGNGLTYYDWGGFLIGEGLPAKLFVDGRMHVWKDTSGYQPFGDYIEMYYGQNYTLFKKYNFQWVLLPDDCEISRTLKNSFDLGKWDLRFQSRGADYFVRIGE